jgi:hypothetical protein
MPITLQGVNTVSVESVQSSLSLKTVILGTTPVQLDKSLPGLDAMHRLRVSEPSIFFESTFADGAPVSLWDRGAYGAGTLTTDATSWNTVLNTTTDSATGYWIQSWVAIRCSLALSALLRISFSSHGISPTAVSRVGLYSDQGTPPSNQGNGAYFEISGGAPVMVLRSLTAQTSGYEIRVDQSDWNLDPLNGTGTSGVSLDWTLSQQLCISLQFVGTGEVRLGFETSVGLVWAHSFALINSLSSMWAQTATLPVRAECFSVVAAAAPSQLTLTACVVLQEGARQPRPFRHRSYRGPANSGGTALGLFPLAVIRPKSSLPVASRPLLIPTALSIYISGAATAGSTLQWAIILGPTSLGAVGAASLTTDGAEALNPNAVAATAVSGGITLFSGVMPNVVDSVVNIDLTNHSDNLLLAMQNAAGSLTTSGQNLLVLAAGQLTGGATTALTCSGILSWKELV